MYCLCEQCIGCIQYHVEALLYAFMSDLMCVEPEKWAIEIYVSFIDESFSANGQPNSPELNKLQ